MAIDNSKRAQEFCRRVHEDKIEHFFATVEEYSAGRGFCLICDRVHDIFPGTTDFRVWSPPCDPFTPMRWTRGGTASTGPMQDHPAQYVAGDMIMATQEQDPADITLIEEVEGFLTKKNKEGISACDVLVEDMDYVNGAETTAVVKLDADPWIEGSRPRVFIASYALRVGGAEAALGWVEMVDRIRHYRGESPPTLIFGGVISGSMVRAWKMAATLADTQAAQMLPVDGVAY